MIFRILSIFLLSSNLFATDELAHIRDRFNQVQEIENQITELQNQRNEIVTSLKFETKQNVVNMLNGSKISRSLSLGGKKNYSIKARILADVIEINYKDDGCRSTFLALDPNPLDENLISMIIAGSVNDNMVLEFGDRKTKNHVVISFNENGQIDRLWNANGVPCYPIATPDLP